MEDFTFAQMRTFARVARTGSFAKAAQQLDISQPAVSEQIKALENHLGYRLFERRRGTTPLLTSAGQQTIESIEAILRESASLQSLGRHTAERTIVRISVGPYVRDACLKPLLPRIYQKHRALQIEFLPLTDWQVTAGMIEDGSLDLAIHPLPAAGPKVHYAQPILEFALTMLAAPGTRARILSGDCSLDDLQYIFPVRRDLGERWACKLLRDLGLKPAMPPLFVEFADEMIRMVQDGTGTGNLVRSAAANELAAGQIEELDLPVPPLRRLISRSPHAPDVVREIESFICNAALSGTPRLPRARTG
jgi:DNA-binding transcriptional LysR family regulator